MRNVAALRFFLRVTLGRTGFGACLAATPSPERLPVVLSTEEVARLLCCAPGLIKATPAPAQPGHRNNQGGWFSVSPPGGFLMSFDSARARWPSAG